MKFIDELTIKVKAGNGGDGKKSFLHTHLNPRSGPDGGDGGNGGDVYLFASNQLDSFYRISIGKKFVAQSGGDGGSNLSTGKRGNDLLVGVPLGTIIYLNKDKNERILLGELTKQDERMLVAKGGKGGKGNSFFSSSANRTPRKRQEGKKVFPVNLWLELRTIADVGLVGFPNSGKSTLINSLTNSRSKVGDFEFTTLSPQLGVLQSEKFDSQFPIIIADLPGIVEDASNNKGLGLKFIRHISRCKLLIYVLDSSLAKDNLLNDFQLLSNELSLSKITNFQKKDFVIVWNKIDLIDDQRKKEIENRSSQVLANVKYFFLSSLHNLNIEELKQFIFEIFFEQKETYSEKEEEINSLEIKSNYVSYDFTDDNFNLEIKNVGGSHWKVKNSYLEEIFASENGKKYDTLLNKFFDNQKVKELINSALPNSKKCSLLINGKSYLWKR